MRRRLPPLNALRTFDAAARHESFTKAAAELGVTQSAVSKQVALLEEHLNKLLFIRKHKALQLTDEGRFSAKVISDCLDSLAAKLLPSDVVQTRRITLLSDMDFTQLWLFSRLPDFEKRYPDIEVSIRAKSDLSSIASKESFDLAVAWGRSDWRDFEFEPLFTNLVFPVCSPDFFARKDPDASCLEGVQLIHDRSTRWWAMFVNVMKAGKVDPSLGPVYNQTSLCLEAAARGDGITMGDEVTTRGYLEKGKLIVPFPVHLPTPDSYYILAPKGDGFEAEPVRLFKTWLHEQAREHRSWFTSYWGNRS